MKIYLVGIGGTGMSALAGLLKEAGHQVAGSDGKLYYPVNELLAQYGITPFEGYCFGNVAGSDADLFVIGNIVARGNPEAEYILDNRLPYMSLPEALHRFFLGGKTTIAVAGTYGKTSTASLLVYLLRALGIDCGYFIGGKPIDLERNYHPGSSELFVLEADEYETAFFDKSAKFFKYRPYHLVLNPLCHDHLDIYPDFDLYLKAFRDLVKMIPAKGVIALRAGEKSCEEVVTDSRSRLFRYGPQGELSVTGIEPLEGGFRFEIGYRGELWNARLNILGEHNVWNACAALAMLLNLGFDVKKMVDSLPGFRGVARRMELLTAIERSLFYDDFAHHPDSLASALAGFRKGFPDRKIVAVFEPRSWTFRLNHYFKAITGALSLADEVLMMETYQKNQVKRGAPLDDAGVVRTLNEDGKKASLFREYQELRQELLARDFSVPAVYVFFSNGSFGGLPQFFKEQKSGRTAV